MSPKLHCSIFLIIHLILVFATPAASAETKDWTPSPISVENLLAQSRLILVAQPDIATDEILSPEPCLAIARGFTVLSVIRNLTHVPTPANTHIRVLPYGQFQMKNRCGKTGYIRNFRQKRYFPKRPPTKSEVTILFLTVASRDLYFQAIDSFESGSILSEIMDLAPLRCAELETRYREFQETLSNRCEIDSDCSNDEYDSRLSGCGREVFRKHSLSEFTRGFLKLQTKKANEICTRPILDCEKIHVIPACRDHKCVNLVRQPDPEMFLPEGIIRHSCAPHDGPALQFVIPVRGEEAKVTLSLYQGFPVTHQPFEMSWGEELWKNLWHSHETRNSHHAVYCPGQRTCITAESGKLILEKFGGDVAPSPGEFMLRFKDGTLLKGKTLFRPEPKSAAPMRCG